jgi:hypothetical protein
MPLQFARQYGANLVKGLAPKALKGLLETNSMSRAILYDNGCAGAQFIREVAPEVPKAIPGFV